ncbi:uncharacterized protein LOC128214704 isoform X2 [Mya arenaria]|uniref:uncharacterized protein LOC128214704 isoform X2 n=1 Tax=Mya arenaria TaxID=6604 RepID=UPI0022E7AD8C|nr:uncharacterized protein LOC128214704 isoform X2 [Mya arenaria]
MRRFFVVCVLPLLSFLVTVDGLAISNVRLEEGSGRYEGRVEVSIAGIWGTICEDGFDMNDAKVICRMLNMTATGFLHQARRGEGSGPIYLRNLECNGDETSINQCAYGTDVSVCTHSADVSVICSDCGAINVTNGQPASISSTGTSLTVSCKDRFNADTYTSDCKGGTWTNNPIFCRSSLKIQSMRLANGISLYDGRIELQVNGSWGTICGRSSLSSSTYYFLREEAEVICYSMFGKRSIISYHTWERPYGRGNGTTYIDQLRCNGNEDTILDCNYVLNSTCSHYYDAFVACNLAPLNFTDIRLVGNDSDAGRVELKTNNTWGTVCPNNINTYTTTLLCKMLNMKYTHFLTSWYDPGTAPILVDYFWCYSHYTNLAQCKHRSPSRGYCTEGEILSLICSECGVAKVVHGKISSYHNKTLTVTCDKGYDPPTITLYCMDGGWSGNATCIATGYPLDIQDVRLAPGPYHGRVELKVNNTWGTVCGNGFNSSDAIVVCRMFGLSRYTSYTYAKYGGGKGPIYMSNLGCNGGEKDIRNCTYTVKNSCVHSNDASVLCNGRPLNISEARLINGTSPYIGRAEIKVNGTWGTICDRTFDKDANLQFCKMFGLKSADVYSNAQYGHGSGPVFVDELWCYSSDASLNNCLYRTYNACSHQRDVSAACYGPKRNVSDVRLVNGTGPDDGRAELLIDGIWGTICDDSFNINDAEAICAMLGKKGAQFFTAAYHGQGTGPVHIDRLDCQSSSQALSDCPYLYTNTCSHARDVSVVCNDCGKPDIHFWDAGYFSYNRSILYADCSYYKKYVGVLELTCDSFTKQWITNGECQEYRFPLEVTNIRLVNGSVPGSGRVELMSMNTWGTICGDNFDLKAANVICKMIGYPPAKTFFVSAHYGPGFGPIFVDDLTCNASAKHINNCSYTTEDNCDHNNDVSVICTDCGNPTPANGFVNSTQSHLGTIVTVGCNRGYRLSGSKTIVCDQNGWSQSVFCHLIDCGDPTPEYGSSNATTTGNGTIVLISCDEGYTLEGSAIISCQENDIWTDSTICNIVDCGYPKHPNVEFILSTNMTSYGSIAVASCSDGYGPTGSTTIECLASATWESFPTCEIIDCGSPVPSGGIANDSSTTYGTFVSITCTNGKVKGDPVITCQQDGIWSDYPTCIASDCGILSVSNGLVTSLSTTIGSIANVMCNEGYFLTGYSSVVCTEEGWDGNPECSKQDCGSLLLNNGHVTFIGGTLFGDVAHAVCDTGFSIKGDATITCEDGPAWSSTPSCIINDCGSLEAPESGVVTVDITTVNSTAVFKCHDGYLLTGYAVLACMSYGEWSHEPPTCLKKSGIGGPCSSSDFCAAKKAMCSDNKCTCASGIYNPGLNTCDIMPLLPYGKTTNDHFLNGSCGEKISFAPGIPVFSKTYFDLYVCFNGIVSFERKYQKPTPPTDRFVLLNFDKRVLIAPYFADFNRKNGRVSYRTYDILKNNQELEENRYVISMVDHIVQKFAELPSFSTKFLLIATWEKLENGHGQNSEKETVTFQLNLVSDGSYTFALFTYENEEMVWNVGKQVQKIWIGYYAQKNRFYTHPFSFSNQVLRMNTVEIGKSEKLKGVVLYRLTKEGKTKPNNAVNCISWYNRNIHEKIRINQILSLLPHCPCDIDLGKFDPWFWKLQQYRWHDQQGYGCVDMLQRPDSRYTQYGKSCCYDLNARLLTFERPFAGSFRMFNPHILTNGKQHYENDILPKDWCCNLSGFCNLYYELRPTGSCYRKSPYSFGSFWGDPHFQTLDGMNFTFNGLGEFTLLQIDTANISFNLQARTTRAIKQDGNVSDATIFSAFASMDDTGASIHVELNQAKTGLAIYANTVDITGQFQDNHDFNFSSNGTILLAKTGGSLFAVFQKSGIALNISVNIGMLSLRTIIPDTFSGITKGLLGNYDGDPTNDFQMPNGTFLNANMTEREVFDYGKHWEINTNASAFFYPDGTSHDDYHNHTYIPRFLDEVDKAKISNAELVCGGSQNLECIFDFVFTDIEEVGEMSNAIKVQAESSREEIKEVLPFLEGCSTLNVTKGERISCELIHSHNDSIYFLKNNIGAEYHNTNSTLSFIYTDSSEVELSVVAKNTQNRSSTAVNPLIILCTGCNGRGHCNGSPRGRASENEQFQKYTCICDNGYEGFDCENEVDGCAAEPCALGRNCSNLSIEQQIKEGKAYKCGPCPKGFVTDVDNDRCADVDECSAEPTVCDVTSTCQNTVGSFICICNTGYRMDGNITTRCHDINECDEALHNCTHKCNNFDGGFNCSCPQGYNLNQAAWTCIKNTSLNCSECYQASGCEQIHNETKCFCVEGFELDKSGKQCKDVDECARGVCSQGCTNTNGSFYCSCFAGFELVDRANCEECSTNKWGVNCSNDCECTGQGAEYCDPVKGCICLPGWEGPTCNDDINECNRTYDLCQDVRKDCENNLGSFSCNCIDGFIENDEGKCKDIDECSNPLTHNCDPEIERCVNTKGGFTCECVSGYIRNGSSCKDINECTLKTSGCEQMCENKPGTYNCLCYFGYKLNDDRKTCTKVEDPCKQFYNKTCSHYCVILKSEDKAECRCSEGYRLMNNEVSCEEVNECAETPNICGNIATCTNLEGSFQCNCPSGTKLQNDGITCSECDEFHHGVNCSQECMCLHGSCDKKHGCDCNTGWMGESCDADVDECAAGTKECEDANTVCINTPGDAICICEGGFVRNETTLKCEDINECNDSQMNSCEQRCVNVNGSYKCECHNGFTMRNGTCRDINECEKHHDCHHSCENTVGSYRCSCREGFKLDLSDRRSCKPDAECDEGEEDTPCNENQYCLILNGNHTCECFPGFETLANSSSCKDKDECAAETNPCDQNCTNTDGSFVCGCNTGFILSSDKFSCMECEDGFYGDNCSLECSCSKQSTERCDPKSGTCICKNGWSGNDCSDDIDECKNKTICQGTSVCLNTNGSYRCICDKGFIMDSAGICTVCRAGLFGKNCENTCGCNIENTVLCDHVTGNCTCKQGWSGGDCTDDVDECKGETDVCSTRPNSTCINSDGSFKCECNEGFFENGPLCNDVDECKLIHNCTFPGQECVNKLGSYSCKCKRGYHGDGISCTMCSNSTYGENCSSHCTCNVTNTEVVSEHQICQTENGQCTCKQEWEGKDCDTDKNECLDETVCSSFDNSGCHNLHGNYSCDCLRDYEHVNGTCIGPYKNTEVEPDSAIQIEIEISFNWKTSGLNFNVSSTYEEYKKETERMLEYYYNERLNAEVDIYIKNIWSGSLHCLFVVTYSKEDPLIAKALSDRTRELEKAELTFFGDVIHPETVTLPDLCDANCNHCVLKDGFAICRTDSSDSTHWIVVGTNIGGAALLIILVLSAGCLLQWYRNGHAQKRLGGRAGTYSMNTTGQMDKDEDFDRRDGTTGFATYHD